MRFKCPGAAASRWSPRGFAPASYTTVRGKTFLLNLKGTSKNAPVNDGLAMDANVLWFWRGFVGAGRAFPAS